VIEFDRGARVLARCPSFWDNDGRCSSLIPERVPPGLHRYALPIQQTDELLGCTMAYCSYLPTTQSLKTNLETTHFPSISAIVREAIRMCLPSLGGLSLVHTKTISSDSGITLSRHFSILRYNLAIRLRLASITISHQSIDQNSHIRRHTHHLRQSLLTHTLPSGISTKTCLGRSLSAVHIPQRSYKATPVSPQARALRRPHNVWQLQ